MSKLPAQSTVEETAGFVGNLVNQARLVWRLLRDGRVPAWLKLIPAAGLVYLLSPIDLLPDLMLPGLGELDDLAVLLISIKTFVQLAPPDLVREHLEQLMGKRRGTTAAAGQPSEPYIDASYRVVEPDEQDQP